MKIYFAGSIRAGRADANIYADIVEMLKKHGQVLTEHVAAKDLDNPAAKMEEVIGKKLPSEPYERDRMIFDLDMAWLAESDVIVAEITRISMGVGFELGVAWKLNKPIICLYRPSAGSSVSAMVGGCPDVKMVNYEQPDELKTVIESELNKIRDQLLMA